jgi:hypothetical protein
MGLFPAGPTYLFLSFPGNFWSGLAIGLTTALLAYVIKLLRRTVLTRLARRGRYSGISPTVSEGLLFLSSEC